jgi:hypothetical protein
LILIELIPRHLEAYTEVKLLFGFSVLTKVALDHLHFGPMNYSKVPVGLFLADNVQTTKLASCINYSML